MSVRSPWWDGLDLRVLRHVRGVLRRRGLELTLVERRPEEAATAFAPISHDDDRGAGLAVIAPALSSPELALIESMLGEAALDVASVLREQGDSGGSNGSSAAYGSNGSSAAYGSNGSNEASASNGPNGPNGSNGPNGPNGHARGMSGGGKRDHFHGIFGAAPPMQELYDLLERIAPADSTVLVQGENGTGKELVSRAIHLASPRRDRKFVVTNCSAFNDNLLDSELFGHKRGAFTGAVADKPGLFEIADTGTFFLDEIGDMSPALQVKVLRVLQEGTFNRVGDTDMRKVDVRIIAATNRDLRAMVAAGQFREDLFYRIHVLSVMLPSLRERKDDIPLLTEQFLAKHRRSRPKRLSPECAAQMLRYPWPGNVRELENEIERLVVLAGDSSTIGLDLLSPRIRTWTPTEEAEAPPADTGSLPAAIEALERRMIGAAMRRHGGNKTRAAEELKVSRRNLIRLVQKYQLEK